MIRSNGSSSLVGRASIVSNNDIKGTFAGYLIRLRITDQEKLIPKYLLWYMKSHQARLYIEGKAKSTSGVNNINSEEISGLPVPLFSNTEQQLIIEAIESRVSVCEDIENTVKKALQQTLSMRQSVLKMAFEGRL